MADAKKPLSGIRILELGPYVALPMTGRILASMGAEVIKVETNKVLDEMNFIPAWSRGGGQPEFQRAKKRVTIDVRTAGGLEVFKELVKVSDVFMTNFRRNILDRWGIDFPELRRVRPDIILMWQTGLGGIGPYYTYKSYGILVQHMGGVSLMSGEEGEPPATINSSYSDYHTGVFQPVAIMGALMRRRLTGQPATMESSIFKSGAVTAGPAVLDYQSTGRMPPRIGNRDLSRRPTVSTAAKAMTVGAPSRSRPTTSGWLSARPSAAQIGAAKTPSHRLSPVLPIRTGWMTWWVSGPPTRPPKR